MIACFILVLALTDYKFACQPVNAANLYQTTVNDVRGKLKRSAEGMGCQLPAPLTNGVYTPSASRCRPPHHSSPYCRMVPGTKVSESSPIWGECNPGYTRKNADKEGGGRTHYVCLGGQWSPPLPVCVESHYNSQNLPQFQSSSSFCGRPAEHLMEMAVPGNIAEKGAWPWMAIFGLYKNNTQNGEIHWFCVGTLVTTRHILTAAHCVADYRRRNTFFARFNDIDLDSTSDNDGIVDIEIQRNNIIVHPGFKKEQIFSHNIAIIKLNSDLPITDFIRPVCLPTPDFNTKSFTNETVYFVSWGQTDNDREWSRKPAQESTDDTEEVRSRYKPILHELQSTVINQHECNYNYRNYQSDDFVIINWDLICASVPTNKSCQGDAGSPLMLRTKGAYVLVGVVATPFRCYDELFPRLFTRLSTFMDWIIANLKL